MAYYRFENLDQVSAAPSLSTGKGAIIKGRYLTLRNNNKVAGTGSELHYHPNELIVFSLVGKLNCIVGKDRRILSPGVMVHMPSKARHSIKATEDGPVSYLYVKDNTWGLQGFAADEAMSDEAKDADVDGGEDGAIIEGLDDCYYPIIESLDARTISAERRQTVAGERVVFSFFDMPAGCYEAAHPSPREKFVYIIRGGLDATVHDEARSVSDGDVLHVGRGEAFGYVTRESGARWVVFEPTAWLERQIDGRNPIVG